MLRDLWTRRRLLGLSAREAAARCTRHGDTWRLVWIWRRDGYLPLLRICRLCWGKAPGAPGFTASLSIGLRPAVFRWHRYHTTREWFLTLLGIRLHMSRDDRGVLS